MKNSIVLLLLLTVSTVFSQKKKDILLTIDNQPVYASEFKSVFNKNLDLVIDESQKSVDGYLDLFIDYKLKVHEAYAQGLDKEERYKKEFAKYQDQLSKKYIYDKRVTSELVEEAYSRSLEEVNANHILVLVNLNASPQDSLIAYNKIKSIREKAVNGGDFDALAREYSEEPGADKSEGNLGYFTVFQMVYDFENTAYNTKVGEISKIVRTEFGYHILKINDKREMKPKLSVSHIMVFSNKDKKVENPEQRINELYAMIMQGESFESIAKQFSEDKATAVKGGIIKTFGPGDLRAPKFEEAAYKLKEVGDMSKPIQSAFGWHIIKLNEKFTLPTFEESKKDFEKKVNAGARVRVVTQAINNKIKKKYGYKEGASYLPFMSDFVSDSVLVKKWEYVPVPKNQNKVLFTIGDSDVTYDDFAKYIAKGQKLSRNYKTKDRLLTDSYITFNNKMIVDYYKIKLEEENTEYALTIDEYRNGLLIFDAMQKNIWDVAKTDSLGLQSYYGNTKSKYNWKKRVDVDIVSATNNVVALKAQTLLEKESDIEKVKVQLNTDGKVNVIITSGVYEVDQKELPENLDVKLGVSKIYNREGSSVVVKIKEILEPSTKELGDVKGLVISDYQSFVEKEWMESLHKKYNVVVNNKVLKRIKKQLKK